MSHPIVASANGRAYLAGCSPEERQTLLNEIRIKTPEDWERWGAGALEMIEEWRRRGFTYSYQGYRPDVCTVGVPYRHAARGELFVFNCVLGAQTVKPGQLENEVGPALLEMVGAMPYA